MASDTYIVQSNQTFSTQPPDSTQSNLKHTAEGSKWHHFFLVHSIVELHWPGRLTCWMPVSGARLWLVGEELFSGLSEQDNQPQLVRTITKTELWRVQNELSVHCIQFTSTWVSNGERWACVTKTTEPGVGVKWQSRHTPKSLDLCSWYEKMTHFF